MYQTAGRSGWFLTLKQCEQTFTQYFDFVVIASGIFNAPHIPEIAHKKRFTGKIIHANDLTNLNMIAGDDVIVVGAGKTGLHLATYIKAKTNKRVTLLFKKTRLIIPLRYFRLIPFYRLFFRPFRAAKRPYDQLGWCENLIYCLLQPLHKLMTKIELFLSYHRLGFKHSSRSPLGKMPSIGCGTMLEPDYYQETIDTITLVPDAHIKRYAPTSIVLNNERPLPATTIIFATGYKHNIDFLEHNIQDENQQIWLYKHILHPDLPNTAFVGHAIGLNSLLNSEIAAQWIVGYLTGTATTPSKTIMRSAIEAQKHYYRNAGFDNTMLASCITPNDYFWLKEMLNDMGKTKKLKLGNYFTEYLLSDYAKHYQSTTNNYL